MSKAKKKAIEIFNKNYFVLFDSESDKGEEILVSILSTKCALITVNEILTLSTDEDTRNFYYEVRNYLNKKL